MLHPSSERNTSTICKFKRLIIILQFHQNCSITFLVIDKKKIFSKLLEKKNRLFLGFYGGNKQTKQKMTLKKFKGISKMVEWLIVFVVKPDVLVHIEKKKKKKKDLS